MAKKDALFGYLLADNQSLAASFDSQNFRIRWLDNLILNVATSSVTDNLGTFTVEHRIIKEDGNYSAWCPLEFVEGTPTLNNANDTFIFIIKQISPGEIRVRFTAAGTSPNGTCDIWISGTSLGG